MFNNKLKLFVSLFYNELGDGTDLLFASQLVIVTINSRLHKRLKCFSTGLDNCISDSN
jgi:hypothetical protein